MKNYTYNGQLGSVSIRTTAGVLALQRGVTASVSKELHQAAKKHPVVQALIKTGELTVTGEFAPEQTIAPQNGGATTQAIAAEKARLEAESEAKAAAEAAQAKADADKAAANPDPAIHSLNGATVVDAPVTTELASTPAAPESRDAPTTAAADTNSQAAADQASTSTTDAPAPAADNSAENVTNAESAPKPPTIPQLKKQLDEAGIKYEANAKRDELVALLPKQG